MISLITAMDRNRNIGLNGDMPWGKEMKADLKRFKELTNNKAIVMGRSTFQSLPGVLPNRLHIVLTNQYYYFETHLLTGKPKGSEDNKEVIIQNSVEDTLKYIDDIKSEYIKAIGNADDFEVFVIGGAQIYEQFLPYADKIYVTKVLARLEGDTKFPTITGAWDIAQGALIHHEGDKYGSQYITYTRRKQDENETIHAH